MLIDQLSDRAPIVHGNGFVIAYLCDDRRVHVWGDPRTPRQRTYTGIHDHAFGFESRVLRGSIANATYTLRWMRENGPAYIIHKPVRRDGTEDTKLVPSEEYASPVNVVGHAVSIVRAGDTYRMMPNVFHETFVAEPTVTLMRKTEHVDRAPRILVPVGQSPDNEFDRDAHDPALLRAILADALRGLPAV